MNRILILGGTTEARQLAGRIGARGDLDVTLSLAGRTETPVAMPVPVRVGGFGGAGGLAEYLRIEKIALLVDATHPHAAQISANAAAAARISGVPIAALRRPAWEPSPTDLWHVVTDAADAIRALGDQPRRVFLALGRNEVRVFETAPQHFYLVRSVDPVEPPLAVPQASYILDRGPFAETGEFDLLRANRIEAIVCKNSGGSAAYAKLAAARRLKIPVFMFERPALPDVPSGQTVAEVAAMIDHLLGPEKKRGV
jgi:precorrin-6A/cobalt-precorrin-6A reductase